MASKRGYLTKEGGSHKSWKRRWCTLSGTVLSYFKAPEDPTPLGVIYMEEYRQAVLTTDRPKQRFCFALRPANETGRTYYFVGDTDTDANEWIKALNVAIQSAHLAHSRVLKEYAAVELLADRGVRVSGAVTPSLLAALSDETPTSLKSRTERGWFCDRVVPLQVVLETFSTFGWRFVNAYESLVMGSKDLEPGTLILFERASGSVAAGPKGTGAPRGFADELKRSVGVIRKPTISKRPLPKEISPQLVVPTPGFNIEDGVVGRLEGYIQDLSQPLVEDPQSDMAWYSLYFANKEHDNFISGDREDPFVLSIIREVERVNGVDYFQYRAIVFLETGNEQVTIPVQAEQVLNAGQVLEIACPAVADRAGTLRRLDRNSPVLADLQKDLLASENEQYVANLKFGLLYCKPGQTHERQMFGNEHGSPAFNEFLENVGEKITLKGWPHYRGGLNVTTDITGTHSVFARYSGYNIMFHVSTLLPYSTVDAQQLERKRHIGNDIVTIVFQDEPGIRWSPMTISSQFLHVFIVVERFGTNDKGQPLYRLNVISNERVPAFGPVLPDPPVFVGDEQFRHFILSKLINAEKAAYMAPAFQSRRKRTLRGILQQIHDKFFAEARKNTHQSRLDDEAQLINRTVPSSSSSMDLAKIADDDTKKWTLAPELIDFAGEIMSGDQFGPARALLGTDRGLLLLSSADGVVMQVASDKPRRFEHIGVVEDMGIFIAIAASAGSASHIFWSNMCDASGGGVRLNKVPDTKNATTFSTYLDDNNELTVVVASKKVIQVFVWQPSTSVFVHLKSLTMPDIVHLLKLGPDGVLFVGTGSDFLRVTLRDGAIQTIPLVRDAGQRFEPIAITLANTEVLLSHNKVSTLVSMEGKQTRDVTFKWSATPLCVAFFFPVVVGVTANQIEIRSLINGSLLETKAILSTRVVACRSTRQPYQGRLYTCCQQGTTTVTRLSHGMHRPLTQED